MLMLLRNKIVYNVKYRDSTPSFQWITFLVDVNAMAFLSLYCICLLFRSAFSISCSDFVDFLLCCNQLVMWHNATLQVNRFRGFAFTILQWLCSFVLESAAQFKKPKSRDECAKRNNPQIGRYSWNGCDWLVRFV